MTDVFAGIKHLLKTDGTTIDNNTFRLHYKVTTFILVACSILLTQKQYFSDPIDCYAGEVKVGNDILDPYCWIHDTYTVPELLEKQVGKETIAPGVGNSDNLKKDYHSYYQWVTLFVYLQAILFYLPRYIWKLFEGGKVKMLTAQLSTPIVDDDVKKDRLKVMVDYFTLNIHQHNRYAIIYIVCELLNFINVIGQIYFTDVFLGYTFTTYGKDVVSVSNKPIEQRYDAMDKMFPKVTACNYYEYGASGSTKVDNALCVLPLNILNEKIFIFLWFWYIIVAVFTALGLLYRMITFLVPGVRTAMLRVQSRLAPRVAVDQVAGRCYYGDWFILVLLGKNVDPLIFKDFMLELGKKFKGIDE